jgi:hypothetical protein
MRWVCVVQRIGSAFSVVELSWHMRRPSEVQCDVYGWKVKSRKKWCRVDVQ